MKGNYACDNSTHLEWTKSWIEQEDKAATHPLKCIVLQAITIVSNRIYTYATLFACFYNIWHATVQLHMLSMKHKNFIYIVQIKTTSPTSVFVLNWTWFNWCTFMYHTRLIQTFWNTWCEKQIRFVVLKENNL